MNFCINKEGNFLLSLLLFYLLLLSPFLNLFAQESGAEVEFYFTKDTIQVKHGETFTNFLNIKNNSTNAISIKSLIGSKEYPGLLMAPSTPTTVESSQQIQVFVKFIANEAFMKLDTDEIVFGLTYTNTNNDQKVVKASFIRNREDEEEVFIYPLQNENLIDVSVPETVLSFFVENTGYSVRNINIDFKSNFPAMQIIPSSLSARVEGKEKRLIQIRVAVRQQKSYSPNYIIHLKTTDLEKNKLLSITNVKVIPVANTSQVQRNSSFSTDKNFAELRFNQLSNGFDYTQLKTNFRTKIAADTYVTFNAGVDYYNRESLYSIYNTYLEFSRKGYYARIGNIYGIDYDYSISGVGIKLFVPLGENRSIETIGTDDNYNLYSNYLTQIQGAKTIGGKYNFGKDKSFSGKISYLFNHDPTTAINSNIAHYQSSLQLSDQHNFRFEIGGSHENQDKGNASSAGFSTAFNYEYRGAKWDVSSVNNFSSKSYAGHNRGTLNLYQNIGYRWKERQRFYFQYQNSQSKPEYLYQYFGISDPLASLNSYLFYSSQSFSTGYEFIKNKWTLSLGPQIEKQKNITSYMFSDLMSYRFRASVSTFIESHQITFSTEYSYSTVADNLHSFSSFKTLLNYGFKKFSLNVSAFYNPNTIYDLNYYSLGSKSFFNYNAYGSYNFKFLQNNITGTVSAGLNHSELYKNINQNINSSVEYNLGRGWAATSYANYSKFQSTSSNNYTGDNYQLMFGAKKYFSNTEQDAAHTVVLHFFQDQNLNGILDKAEPLISNTIVRLDSYVAKTDRNGKVVFRNVPIGTYKIKVNENSGIRMLGDNSIQVSKSIKQNIALGRSNKVKGKLVEVKQHYDTMQSEVRGILVYAQDQDGHKIYTAVDQNAEFEFFLKNGSYAIFIESDAYDYIERSQIIHLDNSDLPEKLVFKYLKKNMEIKVKKF